MDRKKILIADKELNEVRDLRKALITAGYEVRMVDNGADAMAQVDSFKPDLVLAEVRLPRLDGAHLLQELRNRPATQFLPLVLMGSLKSMEERISTMKLPIDDYLQKPLDIDEVMARIDSLIREVETSAASSNRTVRGFNGTLTEMNLVDLLQTLEVGKKTGILKLSKDGKEGAVYISEGQVIDATLDGLEARQALLRMFTWAEGDFQVEMRNHDRPRVLTVSNRDLISEGITRQYRWGQLVNQLPPLQSVVTGNQKLVAAKLSEEEQKMAELLNGSKRIIDLVEECPLDDLRALAVLKNLFDGGYLDSSHQEPEPINGNYLEYLKKRYTNGYIGPDKITGIFSSLLRSPNEGKKPIHDRRRFDRRASDDRRQYERRRDARERLKTKIYLNKSELLMIREKLLH
jgi:CheY-like chemotaxis protein